MFYAVNVIRALSCLVSDIYLLFGWLIVTILYIFIKCENKQILNYVYQTVSYDIGLRIAFKCVIGGKPMFLQLIIIQ